MGTGRWESNHNPNRILTATAPARFPCLQTSRSRSERKATIARCIIAPVTFAVFFVPQARRAEVPVNNQAAGDEFHLRSLYRPAKPQDRLVGERHGTARKPATQRSGYNATELGFSSTFVHNVGAFPGSRWTGRTAAGLTSGSSFFPQDTAMRLLPSPRIPIGAGSGYDPLSALLRSSSGTVSTYSCECCHLLLIGAAHDRDNGHKV